MTDSKDRLTKSEAAFEKANKKVEELKNQTRDFLEERKEARDESKTELEEAQEKANQAVEETNKKNEELGEHTSELYDGLTKLQVIFDLIRNIPSDKKLELTELEKVRSNWKSQAEKIEDDYEMAAAKGAGVGALGASAGVAVAALGPSLAMGVATTFGVASTGTAISALSGAAATNAALAWLGGGTLMAGGGGMVAGNILLALTGPVGWTVAGVAILSGGGMFLKARNEKEQLESIFTAINIRDRKSYELSIVELSERIGRIQNEAKLIQEMVEEIRDFGLDYEEMSEQEQYKLGIFVNFMHSSTQLLVDPILGLQANYSKEDYLAFLSSGQNTMDQAEAVRYEEILIFLANLLYKIELTEKDKKIIWKTLRSNKELMESMNLSKKELNESIMENVEELLNYKEQLWDF